MKHLALCLALLMLVTGCAPAQTAPTTKPETGETPNQAETQASNTVPFEDGELYAVAYLGYETPETLAGYAEKYLGGVTPPTFYLSGGEYYLVIPRYPDMALTIFKNDIQTMEPALLYEDTASRPFVVCCNVSDIFPDAVIRLTYGDETAECSPFISLKDGSVQVGELGRDITE